MEEEISVMSEDTETASVIGCFSIFALILSIVIPLAIFCDNRNYKKFQEQNEELHAQNFEIKEIFTQKHGNKNANSYITYECIVENIETKKRFIAHFDENSLPVTGEIWKMRFEGFADNFTYYLCEKVE